MPPPVVAVVYAEATAPVVRAQTPPLLRALRGCGRRVDAAVFTSPRAVLVPSVRKAHQAALAAIAAATGREPWRRTHLPGDRRLARLGERLALALVERDAAGAVLLCRQPRATIVGIAARAAAAAAGGARPRVVLDLRGIRDEEYLMTVGRAEAELTPDEQARLATYREQEAEAARGADAVVCVSRPMQRLVAQRHGVADARIARVPCPAEPVADAEALRAAARKELGVDDGATLVAYSGTLAAWQMPEASILLFRSFRVHRPNARLLFLTTDPGAAKAALANADLPDALVRTAPPGETAKLLAAADYGLLLRADSLVNRVACPVKFGEYLACGVRPVLTPWIGDQSDTCVQSDLGVVVGTGDLGESAKRLAMDAARPAALTAEGRERRRAWAREHLAPERAARLLLEFLDRLEAEPASVT